MTPKVTVINVARVLSGILSQCYVVGLDFWAIIWYFELTQLKTFRNVKAQQ